MKNLTQNRSHLISQAQLCWSPVTALRSEFSYPTTTNNNMIQAGKDYSRVREEWDD